MLHRATMGEIEPPAVNLHPGSALLERGGYCQPAWGNCRGGSTPKHFLGIGQPGQEMRENSLPHKPGANNPQAVPISLAATARGNWSGCLQVGVEVLLLSQAPSPCRGGRSCIRGVHPNRGKTAWATEALGKT